MGCYRYFFFTLSSTICTWTAVAPLILNLSLMKLSSLDHSYTCQEEVMRPFHGIEVSTELTMIVFGSAVKFIR